MRISEPGIISVSGAFGILSDGDRFTCLMSAPNEFNISVHTDSTTAAEVGSGAADVVAVAVAEAVESERSRASIRSGYVQPNL